MAGWPFIFQGRAAAGLRAGAVAGLLAACSSGGNVPDYRSEWVYQPPQGFVHEGSGESRSAPELMAHGRARAQDGDIDEALDAFHAIQSAGVARSLKEEALLEEARTLAAARRRREAHAAYLQFANRFPGSPLVAAAVREGLDNAFTLAEEGESHRFVGVHLYSSSEEGVQAVRDLLVQFPREDFSGAAAFRLAEFFFDRGEFEVAAAEFEAVRREYARTPWAEAALFRVGLCHVRRFQGVPYDPKPLVEARQRFEKFLQDFPSSPLVEGSGGERGARQWLAKVKSLQAERELEIAHYYRARGRTIAARTQYSLVLKEFPGTEAAGEARQSLEGLPANP